MADIFLSYSREDHERAKEIATALTASGYEVFWDVEIPPGKSWADILEEKLSTCKAAIVLWSKISTASKWVREEARIAHDRGKLMPVLIDGSTPPFGFGEIQAADLRNWHGDINDPHWRLLLAAVSAAVAKAPAPSATVQQNRFSMPLPAPRASFGSLGDMRKYALPAIGVIALIAAIGFRFWPTGQSSRTDGTSTVVSGSHDGGTTSSGTTSSETGSGGTRAGGTTSSGSSGSTTADTGADSGASAPPAAADGEILQAGITRDELVKYLGSIGYKAVIAKDSSGTEIVKTSADGIDFDVYFYDCNGERCPEIQFASGWRLNSPPTQKLVNDWNLKMRYVRAYATADNSAVFAEMDVNLTDATSNAQIERYLKSWKLLLADFKKHFGI